VGAITLLGENTIYGGVKDANSTLRALSLAVQGQGRTSIEPSSLLAVYAGIEGEYPGTLLLAFQIGQETGINFI
jgi:hypothetical protein